MFNLFKKLKEKHKEEVKENLPQVNHTYAGMQCTSCGYVSVDIDHVGGENMICPNCGSFLVPATFVYTEKGFSLVKEKTVKKHNTGGHYRVRKAGPAISHHHGNIH